MLIALLDHAHILQNEIARKQFILYLSYSWRATKPNTSLSTCFMDLAATSPSRWGGFCPHNP